MRCGRSLSALLLDAHFPVGTGQARSGQRERAPARSSRRSADKHSVRPGRDAGGCLRHRAERLRNGRSRALADASIAVPSSGLVRSVGDEMAHTESEVVMRLSRVGGMVTFFAGVAGAGTAVSDPFYFASIDYYASANAAVVSANNSYPDGKSASGFPAIDQPGPLSAAASPLAYVSPDGVSYGTGFVDASGHIDPAVLGVDIHGTVSAQSGSGDFFNDVYYASAGSG